MRSDNSSRSTTKSGQLIFTVALISMIGPFSIDTYLPAFPSIESDLGVSRAILSQTLGAYLAGFAVMTLFWGPLSDRVGRRNVMVISITLYIIASLSCASAASFNQLFVSRVLQGVAASGGFVASRATIRDAFDNHGAQKAMSYIMMLFSIAPAIAPVLGGFLHHLAGWRSIFHFLAAYGLLALLLILRFIPETLAPSARRSFHPVYVFKTYLGILANLRFMTLVFSLASGFAGLFIYIAGAPTVIFDFLGLGSNDFWIQFVPVTMGIMLGSWIASRLIQVWGTQKVVNGAFFVIALACIANLAQAIWLPVSPVTVVTPIVLYATGLTMAMPGITISALDCFPKNRGSASAMQSFNQMMVNAVIASFVAPLLSGELMHFVTGQLCCFLAAFILWRISNR